LSFPNGQIQHSQRKKSIPRSTSSGKDRVFVAPEAARNFRDLLLLDVRKKTWAFDGFWLVIVAAIVGIPCSATWGDDPINI